MRGKLEKLSPEQEALIAIVRDEWIDFALNSTTPMDKSAAKQGIEWMYSIAGLNLPRTIIYAESPIACQIIANLCKSPQIEASVEASVWASVWASVRDSVEASVFGYIHPAWRDVLSDAGWVAYYDYFTRIKAINNNNFNKYLEYMRAGVFYGIFLQNVAIICGRPQYIARDARGRLHAENKPAVLWNDGWGQYFWHGVSVPQKLIETPEQITQDDLAKEQNAEVRRAMMEKLGERFFSLLDVEEIARDNIGRGEYMKGAIIYRTKERDPIAGDYIQYVKVICHSTGREYMLCVPPHLTTPLAAVAWTFGKEEKEYAPLVEA